MQLLPQQARMPPLKPKLATPLRDEQAATPPGAAKSGGAAPEPHRTLLSAWMEDRQLSIYVLLFLTAGGIYVTFVIFRPFLTALFIALILAIAFSPMQKFFSTKLGSSTFASVITTVFALVIVLVPLLLISARIAAEASKLYSSILQPLASSEAWPRYLDSPLQKGSELTGIPVDRLRVDVKSYARHLVFWVFGVAVVFGKRFAREMVTLGLAFLFLQPLLQSSDEFRAGALSFLPLSRRQAEELAQAVNDGVIADMYGVVAVALIEGTLMGVGFWLTGLGSPLVWGAVAVVLSCLPFVGVSLVWIPAVAVLALRGDWRNAGILLVWYILVVGATEGFVRSSVVGGRARINSLLITLSIIGAVAAFGAIGVFVGPVLLIFVGTLVRILREEHASTRESQNSA